MATVLVNSMPALHRGSGTATASADVCNTPSGTATVPTPYTNTATYSQAVSFSTIVKINKMNALTASTTIPSTSGDEAGSSGGTTSGTVASKATFTTFSANVLFGGQGAARGGDATSQNGTNAVGTAAPSS